MDLAGVRAEGGEGSSRPAMRITAADVRTEGGQGLAGVRAEGGQAHAARWLTAGKKTMEGLACRGEEGGY